MLTSPPGSWLDHHHAGVGLIDEKSGLVDGWATRFLRDLFRHFTVLFVGYRADDLVVRYMLQALAVSMTGESDKPRVFAFAEIEDDEKLTKHNWQAKGIEPILYRKKDGSHAVLHQTLRMWAERASRGLLGRKSIVTDHIGRPAPPEQDEVVDQVLWALNDGTGATARFLSNQEASPSSRYWLSVLDQHGLLSLDGVPLVSDGRSSSLYGKTHPATDGLAQWLCKHLAEADVLDWALGKGGCLSPTFGLHINYALSSSPNDVPDEMKKAWRFLASPANGAASGWRSDAFAIKRQIESGAWDLGLKHEIIVMLEPLFVLKRDKLQDIIRKAGQDHSDSYPLEVEVTFSGGDEVLSALNSIRGWPDRDTILASLLDDCAAYLRRAMEVQEYFGKVSSDYDWTSIWLPSIKAFSGPHRRPLIDLIALVAGCLDAASRADPLLARSQVDHWKTIGYPVFRRLVCYGLALPNLFSVEEALGHILNAGSPLWRHGCDSELGKLLAHLWPSLDESQSRILVQRILAGPPAEFYGEGLSAAEIQEGGDLAIAERLAALRGSGRALPDDAEGLLSRLEPKYVRAGAETPSGDKPLDELSIDEVARSLADGVPDDRLHRRWSSMLSDHCEQSLAILRDLAASSKWPKSAWKVVLDKAGLWAINEPLRSADLASILEMLSVAPPELITNVIEPLSHLLEFFPRVADDLEENKGYWTVWSNALAIALCEPIDGAKPVEGLDVIHTVPSRLTQALFEWTRRRSTAGKHEVPESFWHRLGAACASSSPRATGPLCVAAMQLSWLFAKNREWTIATLLPSFDWHCPDEARVVWQGFLFGPRVQTDLWPLLRDSFLATYDNVEKLPSEALRNLYQLFAEIVVRQPDWLTNEECQRIVTKARRIGRELIAWVFWRNLEASGDRATSLWRDRIGPWLDACWQPDEDLKDPETSGDLIRMALAAGDAFPEAVDTIEHRLMAVKHAGEVIFEIDRTKMPEMFPAAATKVLDLSIDRSQRFYKPDLARLLARISSKWPGAHHDKRFIGLSNFAAT
jgi:hypothetical protein